MTKTVVVTGVGAIIGQGIAQSLRQCRQRVRIVGVDRKSTPLEATHCDHFVQKPDCAEDSPAYLDFWRKLTDEQKVDLVLPGLEVDLFFLMENKDALETKLAFNDLALTQMARDKWKISTLIKTHGLPWIPTILKSSWNVCQALLGPPPYILKPREGNGSRGVVRVENRRDLIYWSQKSPTTRLIVQRYVGSDDEEYTVGVFGLGKGQSLPPIIMRRTLSIAGNTQYAEVTHDDEIAEAVRRLVEIGRPIGPTNFQFRKEAGNAYLLEINPRFSSSTSLRARFGYNEAQMALDYYLEERLPDIPQVKVGKGWRFLNDYVEC